MYQAYVTVEDAETVHIRLAGREYIGLGFDELDDECPDRGLRVGCVGVVELTLTPKLARALFLRLVEALTEED